MKCDKCGTDAFLPFRCPFCGGHYCSDHRLPENHQCTRMDQARMSREETRPVVVQKQGSYEYSYTYPTFTPQKKLHFSTKEVTHLLVATLLIVGVGLSLIGFPDFLSVPYFELAIFVPVFTASFLMHELSHKIMAQRLGLWAEFRLILIGSVLTLLSIVSPFLKFIAPGAVMVSGASDRKIIGKTSIAGPATNLALGTAFLVATFLFENYSPILAPIASFNAWIALFNLIPFTILDGQKIFAWNKGIWAVSFGISLLLTVFSFLV